MTERRGTKALELWCRRITDGYPGVNVQNMTTSWRDGLAFCAMIHHFRPDLIDFDSLNKDDVYGNNELAFRTAAEHLGIPALLDAEDMASCSIPDRLSILTYLSQFYQCFGGSSPNRLALSGTKESTNEVISPVPESTTPKVGPRVGMRRDACAVCGMPIFLAEKLVISRTAYHRTCFRCARCKNQLTPGNYYETEKGEYCCETCPDEEKIVVVVGGGGGASALAETTNESYNGQQVVSTITKNRKESLSDEEKSVQLMREQLTNEISSRELTDKSEISQSAQMRLSFINDHLLTEESNENDATSLRRRWSLEKDRRVPTRGSPISSTIGDVDVAEIVVPRRRDGSRTNESQVPDDKHLDIGEFSVSDVPGNTEESVDSTLRLEFNDDDDDDKEAKKEKCESEPRLESGKITIERDTKDKGGETGASNLLDDDDDGALSLVQRRMKIFESPTSLPTSVPTRRESSRNRKNSRDGETESPTKEEAGPASRISVHESPKEPEDSPRDDSNAEAVTILTASGIDLGNDDENYPEDLNPFASDGEVDDLPNRPEMKKTPRTSTNPFGSSEDEDEERDTRFAPRPAVRKMKKIIDEKRSDKTNDLLDAEKPPTKRVLKAPRINLNPFWSDEDEDDDDDDEDEIRFRAQNSGTPVPRPRTIKQTTDALSLSSWRNDSRRGEIYNSNGSLASTGSSAATPGGTWRKKKPAPPPPPGIPKRHLFASTGDVDSPSSRSATVPTANNPSPMRGKKTRAAPPPPLPTSPPPSISDDVSPSVESSFINDDNSVASLTPNRHYDTWKDTKKNGKDEANRNTRGMMTISPDETNPYDDHRHYTDKSSQGKWKRKKGPAPARPIPHRRKLKVLSLKDVKLELDEIEMQQQGLEKQGVRLEQLIRDRAENGNSNQEASLQMDVEELVLELFVLVNEKNELFRRQAELMLLRRQQRLEEEHADIEYQIRCLLCQPEATKTDFDKQREETLIQRLVEIVERRNEIVECLEMDRRREIEEDRSINTRMGIYHAKNKGEFAKDLDASLEERTETKKSKKTKLKDKAREKILRKVHKKDADKDVDEAEVKLKRQNKKKWF